MTWLYLAVLAYFLNAVSFIVDKYLLSAPIPRPFAYAFWVAVLSSSAVFLIPFGVVFPSVRELAVALVSGSAFFFALVFFFRSVKYGDVAVSAAKAGAFTAVFSYALSLLLLPESLISLDPPSILLMVTGILFLSRAGKSILKFSLAAGLFFAVSFVLLKLTFAASDYVNGVFWTRVGFVLTALAVLFRAQARLDIIDSFHRAPVPSRFLFVFNKLLVGAAFLILYYSILAGDVATVNALLGVQFLFVLVLSAMLKSRIPALAGHATREIRRDRLIGVICIVAGFLLILF